MKFESILPAKLLIILFLAIAATSGFYGKKIYQGLPALRTDQQKTASDLKSLEKSSRAVQAKLVPDTIHTTLTSTLSETLLAVMNNRVRYNVTVGTLIPQKPPASGGSADIEKLSEVVKGTTLQSVRFNMRGSYQTYDGLRQYIAELRHYPVSIAFLHIEGTSFEMGLRVYGNK